MKNLTKIIIASAIGIISFQSQGQTIAVKGGLNLAKMVDRGEIGLEENGLDLLYKPGFHLGATIDLPITKIFSVETGLFASTSGFKYVQSYDEPGFTFSSTYGVNILNAEIPLTFKSTFAVTDNFNIYIGAGGYGAMNIIGMANIRFESSEGNGSESEIIDFDDFGEGRFDAGLRFDTGVEFKGINLGVNYNLGLAPMYDLGYNRILKVTLGYRFGWNKV